MDYLPDIMNYWDNDKEGNYWDIFNNTDSNRDGIGDTPYFINENNIDDYPLMAPFDFENGTITLPPPEPFPTTIIIALAAIGVTIGVGIILYFKKRKT